MKKMILPAMIIAGMLTSCSKKDETPAQKNIIKKGPETTVGHGKGWTWIETTPENVPVTVTIALNDQAVPDTTGFTTNHDGDHGTAIYELALPDNKAATPFDHITVDWNPTGHPPQNVYSFSHFDFHYYMITKAERELIPAFETDSTGFKKYPAAAYLPATYFPIPGGSAKMGVHWADGTSPELQPNGKFTQTFIYGSYNNQVNFYEPMVTNRYLLTIKNTFERTIPQPTKVSKTGYYPTIMRLKKVTGGYEIQLTGFRYQVKS